MSPVRCEPVLLLACPPTQQFQLASLEEKSLRAALRSHAQPSRCAQPLFGAPTRERAQSFRTDDHIERIVKAYERFKDQPGLARVATLEELRVKDGNLSIPLYVAPAANAGSDTDPTSAGKPDLPTALGTWLESSQKLKVVMNELLLKIPTAKGN
ncbi:MAG: N-6 DNA methylase [Verrucomicrobiota bacterium]